ncbi:MAG: acyl-CoA thioesterase [Myxococcota bacterium]
MSLSNRHRFRVIYGDTDRMGVVYYATYFRFFEAGRNELLRFAGIVYRDVEENEGLMLPVVDASARYRAPAGYDDELELRTFIAHVGSHTLRIGYELRKVDDGVLVATGETRHACVSRDGAVCRLPPSIREKLEHGDDA